MKVDQRRVRILTTTGVVEGPVVYWMERDLRVFDNWALLQAQMLAHQHQQPLVIVVCFSEKNNQATLRQYDFMIRGLQEVEKELAKLHIPMYCLIGNPEHELIQFIKAYNCGALVTDFNPLRHKQELCVKLACKLKIPFYEVDTHNIVPCWVASSKKEFGAYTLRPKIYKQLHHFLTDIPAPVKQQIAWPHTILTINWKHLIDTLPCDRSVAPVTWIKPGEKAAHAMLKNFMMQKLSGYEENRNDPTEDAQSNLSPYFHFGQLSAQRVAYEVQEVSSFATASKKAFLEELIIRKELTDNYCFYEPLYDAFAGFPTWGQKSLQEHAKDVREYLYTLKQFEAAKTHDELWNAAQLEMVEHGKMHGYMRMYWAKKILEWSKSPEQALKIALELNDKYELDGQDPNGFVGVAWAIGGLHDRAWFERPIYGKIRYMNYNGCKSKFDVKKYIAKWGKKA